MILYPNCQLLSKILNRLIGYYAEFGFQLIKPCFGMVPPKRTRLN